MTLSRFVVLCLATASLVLPPAAAQAQNVLRPEELLRSVERALPLLERARQDVELASGELEQARGAFDLSFKASAKTIRGYYDNERTSMVIEQPLAPFGLNLYGGYRAGRGLFAPYDTAAQTLSQGELTAGFALPLLRNRATDARRAERQAALLGVDIAERGLDKARLSFYKDALSEYWDWAAAGQQQRVARSLLDLARARDQQLADSIALGQVAPVERTENRRAILQRQSALVSAERLVEMKAIDVSLYSRSFEGAPERPSPDRLPELPRPASSALPEEDVLVRTALSRRPELAALRLKRQQQQVELDLQENSVQPTLDVFSEFSRDFGAGAPSRVPGVYQGGLTFSLPIQNRKATGKQAQARAKLSALAQELRWAEDQVRADVQDALSALRTAAAVLDVVSEELAVARELESLERDRFDLGDSTQFFVNLRELATADAALREARALADYQKAIVTVDAATGQLLDRIPLP